MSSPESAAVARSAPTRLREALDAALGAGDSGLPVADRLCGACVEVLHVDGAAISLIDEGSSRGTFGSSSELSREMDELQFTLGEGPCLESAALGRPVLVDDLDHRDETRWPAFREAALEAGVRAVYALPITVAATRVGALDLFRMTPGALEGEALTGGLLAAELAALPLLDLMAREVDWEEVGSGASWPELDSLERVEVYQATGMIIGQLEVSPAEALARLRAYAFSHHMSASEVAWRIISRQLVLQAEWPGDLTAPEEQL